MASSDLLPQASTRWPCWFDRPIQMTARMRACRFSSARPSSFSASWYASKIGRDRDRVEPEAGALGELGSVGARVLARPVARVGDAEDVLGAERVDGDRADERGVDAAGQAHQDAGEAVLDARSRGARATSAGRSRRRRPSARRRAGASGAYGASGRPRSRCARWAAPEPGVGVRHRRGGGRQVEVDDQQLGHELRRPGPAVAVGVDHQRVAVEDELVLAADEVDVGERAAAVARAAGAQLEPASSLAASYGEPLMTTSSPASAASAAAGRPVLPDVLADRDRDVDAADLHDAGSRRRARSSGTRRRRRSWAGGAWRTARRRGRRAGRDAEFVRRVLGRAEPVRGCARRGRGSPTTTTRSPSPSASSRAASVGHACARPR